MDATSTLVSIAECPKCKSFAHLQPFKLSCIICTSGPSPLIAKQCTFVWRSVTYLPVAWATVHELDPALKKIPRTFWNLLLEEKAEYITALQSQPVYHVSYKC